MAISITSNLAYVDMEFGRFVSRLPELTIALPKVALDPVMGVLMAAIRDQTPIGETGNLVTETDWEKTGESGARMEAVIFSTAANERSGFQYAKARAYGFNTVAGSFWTPPEDPPYPLQGVENANDLIAGAAKPRIEAAVIAAFSVPH